jgi:hypothetical protein
MQVGQNPTDPTDPDLKDLQALLYRLITAPEGVAAGLAAERAPGPRTFEDLERLIEGDDRLSANQRLEIYANAYFYRILDCLKEDFPATRATLGDDNFHNLVTGYLIEYPPTEPSISYAGRHLGEFLCDHPFIEQWPFLADLARLERTLVEVFHAADAEPLDAATMRSVAPEDWPGFGMRTHPALAIVDCEWRVDEFLRAVETAEAGADGRPQEPARSPVSVLVWRKSSRVYYRALQHPERAALDVARAGTTFSAICEAVAAAAGEGHGDDGEVAPVSRLIARLFARWLDDGVFVVA